MLVRRLSHSEPVPDGFFHVKLSDGERRIWSRARTPCLAPLKRSGRKEALCGEKDKGDRPSFFFFNALSSSWCSTEGGEGGGGGASAAQNLLLSEHPAIEVVDVVA